MADEEAMADFPDQDQRAAFCNSVWEEAQTNIQTNKGCCESCGPITVNAEVSGEVTTITHENREKLVVPVVAIVQGVLNGALLKAEEFGKFVNAWEGRPVPVDHPQINGVHVSANLPTILERRNIGHFHNVHVADNKLKGELWIDVQSAESKGFGYIVEAFRNGQMMEVSTAYFADTEPSAGEYNGKAYEGIHRNLRPDHLAVLPNDIGACSIEDGCGAMRTNKGFVMSALEKLRSMFSMPALGLEVNEESMGDRMMAVRKAVDEMDGHGQVFYLVDVFDDFAVYENEGKMYKRSYAMKEDGMAEFTSEPEEVRMEKSFVPVGQEDDPEGSDDQPSTNGNNQEEATMADDKKPEAPELDAETMTAVNWAKSRYESHVNGLVERLTANTKCQFDADELKAMSVETLEKLDASLASAKPDYSGRGMPVTHQQGEQEVEALPSAPPVVMKKEAN